MKKKIFLLIGMLAALLAVFALTSCEDQVSEIDDVLEETTFTENLLVNLSADADEALGGQSLFGRFGFGLAPCVEVSSEEGENDGYPKVITLDFGEDCEFGAGSKSGKIIITVSDSPDQDGSQRTMTFEDFEVNGYEISGTRTYTRVSSTVFTITLIDGQIITPEGQVITHESERTRTKIAGETTETREDDVYEITGSASGVTADGVSYSKTIITPLTAASDCLWIVSGIVETTTDDSEVIVDFGDGECDNLAIRTENGVSEEIEMEFRMKRFRRGQ